MKIALLEQQMQKLLTHFLLILPPMRLTDIFGISVNIKHSVGEWKSRLKLSPRYSYAHKLN